MKTSITRILFFFFLLQMHTGFAQEEPIKMSAACYGHLEESEHGVIECGYLTVPESWDKPDGAQIKVAVVVLNSKSDEKESDAVLFMQGGPGGSGIGTFGFWLNHPLRATRDIVLFDVRGVGNSEPALCPELGEKFLEILAKNQSEEKDVEEKRNATLSCRQDLINKNIDISSYHSISIANDLHALKEALAYKEWNVYAVSYGTYMAQVYAANHPEDIQGLILDSSIDDLSSYYVNNTSNYMGALRKVFELCKNDQEANAEYPDLEKVYFEVIEELERNPLTVSVDKKVISTGAFTYNAEDFKVAIQQALYDQKLVELIPILIYQFRNRNEGALGNLVAAFSSLLALDYGAYYCVSCNETLINNDYASYEANAAKYPLLSGGVSFYKSDFKVCDAWNKNLNDSVPPLTDLSPLSEATFPVLVFSGGFDPITPQGNGQKTVAKFKNGTLLLADSYGHASSFSDVGKTVTNQFISGESEKIDLAAFNKTEAISLATNIEINKGVAKMGNSLSELNPLFLAPLGIALVIMLILSLIYLVQLIKRTYVSLPDQLVRWSIVVTSVTGLVLLISLILALLNVLDQNLYILAFGLPANYHYLFVLALVFLGLLVLSVLSYFITLKKTSERSVLFSIVFSNMLLATYLFYWGIVSF